MSRTTMTCVLAIAGVALVASLDAAAAPADSASRAVAARRAAPARTTAASPTPTRRPGPRMLEDIQIEGEIPVPQVLFVTARDQRRFLQFHHRRYLATSLQLGQSTSLPSGVVVTRAPGGPAKETPR